MDPPAVVLVVVVVLGSPPYLFGGAFCVQQLYDAFFAGALCADPCAWRLLKLQLYVPCRPQVELRSGRLELHPHRGWSLEWIVTLEMILLGVKT